MRESLKLLIDLQDMDIVMDKLKERKAAIPAKIKELQDKYDSALEELENSKGFLSSLQVDKNSKELELASEDEAVKKHQKELNAIKKNEAYKVMLKQIEDAKKEKQRLEDEILEIMQKNEDLKKGFDDDKVKIEQGKETMNKEINSLNEEIKHLLEKIEELVQKRSSYINKIPQKYFKKYEKIRDNRGGRVVVRIEENSCGGCHLSLLPQSINEAMKDEELVTCQNCGRILYWKE